MLFAPETAGRVSARHYAVVWVPFEAGAGRDVEVHLVWPEYQHLEPAHVWVRGLIQKAAAERFGTSELSGGLPAATHESGE